MPLTPRTVNERSSIETPATVESGIRFGWSLFRLAKTPTSSQSGWPRGWQAKVVAVRSRRSFTN